MSKGLYLCWLKPGHESCMEHNRHELVNRIMAPIEKVAQEILGGYR